MTIGEKISKLRISEGLSQEQLAEKISVSRQAVSKWEMDQALPQTDKILLLTSLFGISSDELLRDDIQIKNVRDKKRANRYFGTDGFRGEANAGLTSDHAYKVGRFLGWYFSSSLSGNTKANYRPRIVIGKDTRLSSYMLEYALCAGITASGADAYILHVTTTPSVSYVTAKDEFDCGIMITASHNPFYDNGIKVINRYGEKIDDETASLIEDYIDSDLSSLGVSGKDLPFARKERIGRIIDYVSGRNQYVGYLISVASHSYKNLRIGLDCANGASWAIAKAVFEALGAKVYVIGNEPDGLNVNKSCGSTHIENLCELVKKEHLDVGFAFDGDSDRCLAVDEKGEVIDGDAILYILAKRLKSRGMLVKDTVVATVMSNSGLSKSLEKIGINLIQTSVGDRFVYECMQKNDYSLGGEQSGHIIIKKYASTGDGILTAIMLTEEISDTHLLLGKLKDGVSIFPQFTLNVKVEDKDEAVNDEKVKEICDKIKAEIGENGRLLLRKSGTENVVRIMVEAQSSENCREYADRVYEVLKERGLCL